MSTARTDHAPQLVIRLLGPVDVQVGGRRLAVDTRKAVALLAYVAVAGRPVTREALATLLWPDSAETQARGALRRTLSVLNAGLGETSLLVDRSTVTLDETVVSLDIDHFRDALAVAREHGHAPRRSCESCRSSLQAAVSLSRGPFMDGFVLRDSDLFEEWLLAEREAHGRELAGALERLVSERLAAGAWDTAISTARRWLELDSLHEPAHRALMEAHARAGETSAAIQGYRDAAAILERELGVSPLPETTELYEAIVAGSFEPDVLVTPTEGSPLPEPAPVTPVPPLLGRERELARLRSVLANATPNGRVVAIEGEAGVGKSRLADALVESALRDGHRVIAARCYAGETDIAFGPIVALLRANLGRGGAEGAERVPDRSTLRTLSILLPELADAEARALSRARERGPAARLALFEAVVEGLAHGSSASDSRGTIVRLDDLQWADDSTLEVLTFLARRLDARPLLLLLSWRREELDERASPLIADLPPEALVRLGRLGPEDIRRLIDSLVAAGRVAPVLAVRDHLVDEAEGLPLYVVEALAAADRPPGSVPAGIRALLQGRLAALSDIASQVVAAAAVIGRSFDGETARRVSGRSDDETVDALEELSRRGIISDAGLGEGSTHDFTHARLRDVAYEGTSVARRRLLHRRAAEAYRTHGAPAGDELGRLARIARHEQEAGRASEASVAFAEAGRLALRAYANREALMYLEAALALGHPETASIHERIGDLRVRMGDYPGAITAYETAAATTSPERLAAIERRVARIHLRRGDLAAAEAHLAAALVTLDAVGGPTGPERSAILADSAVVAIRRGDPDRATTLATEAHGLAGGDQTAEAEALRILGLLARERRDLAEARRTLELSLETAEGLDDRLPAIAATNALALVAADMGEADAAIGLMGSALMMARQTGERHLEAALENNLADALEAAGRRDEAMEHLKVAAAAFADIAAVGDEPEPGIWMLESW